MRLWDTVVSFNLQLVRILILTFPDQLSFI